jgi:hypothetical protein
MWNLWVAGTAGAFGGYGLVSGTQSLISIGSAQSGGDFCLAPYSNNPYFLLGGFQLGPVFYGAGVPGSIYTINWRFTKSAGGPGSLGVPMPNLFQLNNGTVLLAEMVYDLQHGYNGTASNSQYIGTVSIDELTYPIGGGIAGGDNMWGSADWAGYVNNGTIVSYTRVFDVSFTNNGGFVGLIAYPGQSAEGAFDGFETLLTFAGDAGVIMMGRNPGEVAYPNGSAGHYFGSGGRDWVSCATSTTLGSGDNKFQLRVQDLFYSQLTSPTGINNDPSTDNSVNFKYSLSGPDDTTPSAGTGAARPLGAGSVALSTGMHFDSITNAFANNGKAKQNITFTDDHLYDNAASPLGIPVVFEGNWSGEDHDPLLTGTYTLPRGRAFGPSQFGVLSLCNNKAQNQITTDRTFYILGIMRGASAGTDPTAGGWTVYETSNVERAPVADNN